MEEQIKLIQCLSAEVHELMQLKENDENEYNDIVKKFDSTFEKFQNIDKELDDMMLFFRNTKDVKIIKFNGFVSLFIMIITFILLVALTDIPLANILLVETVTLVATFAIPIMLASTVFSNIIERYLIKKYPHIRKRYNNVNSLKDSKQHLEQQLMKLRTDRETIKTTLRYREQQLNIKKDELFEFEEAYFSSLDNNNVVGLERNSNEQAKKLVRELQ